MQVFGGQPGRVLSGALPCFKTRAGSEGCVSFLPSFPPCSNLVGREGAGHLVSPVLEPFLQVAALCKASRGGLVVVRLHSHFAFPCTGFLDF
jgi:hypothetical protein